MHLINQYIYLNAFCSQTGDLRINLLHIRYLGAMYYFIVVVNECWNLIKAVIICPQRHWGILLLLQFVMCYEQTYVLKDEKVLDVFLCWDVYIPVLWRTLGREVPCFHFTILLWHHQMNSPLSLEWRQKLTCRCVHRQRLEECCRESTQFHIYSVIGV